MIANVSQSIKERWKKNVDEIAKKHHVNSILVMESLPKEMKVVVANSSQNHYHENDKGPKSNHHEGCPGLYCERIVDTGQALHVPDARLDGDWKNNEDLKLFGLGCYYGLPVKHQDQVVGTVCALHDKKVDFEAGQPSILDDLKQLQSQVVSDLATVM